MTSSLFPCDLRYRRTGFKSPNGKVESFEIGRERAAQASSAKARAKKIPVTLVQLKFQREAEPQ
jgi:hypothetical protein